jgi:hypothetical protein
MNQEETQVWRLYMKMVPIRSTRFAAKYYSSSLVPAKLRKNLDTGRSEYKDMSFLYPKAWRTYKLLRVPAILQESKSYVVKLVWETLFQRNVIRRLSNSRVPRSPCPRMRRLERRAKAAPQNSKHQRLDEALNLAQGVQKFECCPWQTLGLQCLVLPVARVTEISTPG